RPLHRSPLDPVEDFERTRARHYLRPRQHRFGRFVAERTEFSLDRNLHETISSSLRQSQPSSMHIIRPATAPAPSSSPKRPSDRNSIPQPSFPRSILSACRSGSRPHYSPASPTPPRLRPPGATAPPPLAAKPNQRPLASPPRSHRW